LSAGIAQDASKLVWRSYPPNPPSKKGGIVSILGKEWWAIQELNL
jgi:hypothetical protein